MKHKDEHPVPIGQFDTLPLGHHPAAALQRDVRGRPAGRSGVPDRLSARSARDPGAGRLDRRDHGDCRARRSPLCRAGHRHQVHPSHRPHRLQGRRARRGPARRARTLHRHLRRRLHPEAGFPEADDPLLHESQDRDGADALGPRQRGLLAAHEDPGDPARRALRARARQPATAAAASSTSTARPGSGGARRSATPAAGSTTR